MKCEIANTTFSFCLTLLVGTLTELGQMRYLSNIQVVYKGHHLQKREVFQLENIFTFFGPGIVFLSLLLFKSHLLLIGHKFQILDYKQPRQFGHIP